MKWKGENGVGAESEDNNIYVPKQIHQLADMVMHCKFTHLEELYDINSFWNSENDNDLSSSC